MRGRWLLSALSVLAGCGPSVTLRSGPAPRGPSPACNRTAAPTGVFEGSKVSVAGDERTYVLFVPAGYDAASPLPLVFAWHGQSWSGATLRSSVQLEQLSAGRAIFVYPDGLPLGGGSRWDLDGDGDDVALFDALVEDIGGRYCVDRDRLYSMGRSYGAYFTNTLACVRGDWLAASAAVMGGANEHDCRGEVAVWLGHNRDDPTVSITEGLSARDLFIAQNGCSPADPRPVDPSPCLEYQGCRDGRRVVWCENATGGHQPAPYSDSAIWLFFETSTR